MKQLYYIFTAMRPRQWTKNLVVFAGLIFSLNITDGAMALASLKAFAIFCLLSGTIYIFNDIADIEKDKLHEVKRRRPLPSGDLGVGPAAVAATLVAIIALVFAYRVALGFFIVSCIFFVLNLLYSFGLKRVVLLDVVSISLSFVIRAIAGVEALHGIDPTIGISSWLLICTLFLSLFLAFCKRRHELLSMDNASSHREALAEYSPHLIDQLVAISASGAVLSYSIYTIWPETVERLGTQDLVYTIPLVLLGVMRYLYLVYQKDKGGSPSDLLLSERFILIDVFAWIVLVIAIFYVF